MKNDVFIPSPLAEQLKEAAVKQGLTADEVAERAIREFLRSEHNGR